MKFTVREKTPEERARSSQHSANFDIAYYAVQQLKKVLRDPNSLVVDVATVVEGGSTCIYFTAKNGFGGVNSGAAVVYGGLVITKEDNGFYEVWLSTCKDKSGDSFSHF
jgi:hypothetical protein